MGSEVCFVVRSKYALMDQAELLFFWCSLISSVLSIHSNRVSLVKLRIYYKKTSAERSSILPSRNLSSKEILQFPTLFM